ncbi:MAG: hypothetical protein LPK21_11675, partial [Hymenobacteraceae bacterium]|nr:hypothetical protein [Hymenobacteraceae bacterium]MDX5512920.1 hypothetical protein [Hymenobacteraceae bacterium]
GTFESATFAKNIWLYCSEMQAGGLRIVHTSVDARAMAAFYNINHLCQNLRCCLFKPCATRAKPVFQAFFAKTVEKPVHSRTHFCPCVDRLCRTILKNSVNLGEISTGIIFPVVFGKTVKKRACSWKKILAKF